MNTRTGFASCAVLVLLAAANVAAAQQSRERRQERHAEPSQPEPTITTLSEQTFEQADGLYWVRHIVNESGAETCQIVMGNRRARTALVIQTNASDRTFVVVRSYSDPLPAQFTRPEARLNLRLEVGAVAESYRVTTNPPTPGGSASAEAMVPRAALRHLQSAVNSHGGFVVKVGDGEPIRFSVPRRAADAFHECGRGILRGRADRAMDRLNQKPESAPSRHPAKGAGAS
jgi:hypothetical protein